MSNLDLIPRDLWPGPNHRWLPAPHTQGTQARCVPESMTTAMEWMIARAGQPGVRLDAVELYGRTVDPALGGTWVGSVLPVLATDGAKVIGGPGRWTSEWVDLGQSFDLAYSTVMQEYPIVAVTTWKWGYRPWTDGWLRPGAGGQPFSHCIFGYSPACRATNLGATDYGIWCMQSQGSFSPRTGQRVVLSESDLRGASFFACQSVTYSEG